MMRPGFRPSAEAPTTTALFGVRSRLSSAIGRDGGRASGRCRRARPSSAMRRPSSAATIGFTSSSARPRPSGGRNPAHRSARQAEGHRQPGQPLLRHPRAAARPETPGERRVHERPAQGPQRPLRGEAARGHHRPGLRGAQRLQQGLGVEPSHPQDDDRAERGVVTEGGQHLAPGAGAEAHPLDHERRRRHAREGKRRGPRPSRAPPPCAASPGRCGTRPRRRRRSCEGCPGRRS